MSCIGVFGQVLQTPSEVNFQWTVENYSSRKEPVDYYLESPEFEFCGSFWCLELYPSGCEESNGSSISLFLKLISSNSKHNVTFSVRVEKLDGTFTEVTMEERIFETEDDVWGWYDFEEIKLIPTDNLLITCQMKNEECVEMISQTEKLLELETLSKNFEDLFISKSKCDVTIKVKNVEFLAHQVVLAARSSVFDAAFEHDMTERKTGIITIEDCDPDSFGKFLEYLYTGKIEDLQFRDALNLFVTADKYNVLELRSFCISLMQANLIVENVCDAVVLADEYDETKLMSSVQNFFNRNYSKIFLTSGWETLLKNDYRIANKLLKGMSSNDEI